MENTQSDLFQTGSSGKYKIRPEYSPGMDEFQENFKNSDTKIIPDIDAPVMNILSDYIKKLPDNATRKHIARLLINFIIKSAGL